MGLISMQITKRGAKLKRLLICIILITVSTTIGCGSSNVDIPNREIISEYSIESESPAYISPPLPVTDDNAELNEQSRETQPKSEPAPMSECTREDYDEMRKFLPYEPFEIDYNAPYVQNGYFEIDKTVGVLEEYLSRALMGFREVREIPNVLQDNNLIFQTAGFCTRGFDSNENPMLERVGAWYSATPKEHLDLTAKYLYGDECTIDYDNLEAVGYYGYEEEVGLALRYNLVKDGICPIVLGYKDTGDHFQATVVFLTVHNMLPPEYDYCYYTEDEEIRLNKTNAKDFCFSDKPDKYNIRINKGENRRLYLRSVLHIPKE